MREGDYQNQLIKKLKLRFPGCLVLKNDASLRQGIPDLCVLYNDRWAMLEVKTSADAKVQPNQEHYVRELDAMSFAAFIYPENEEAVLNGLQQAFGSPREACVSKP